MNNEVIEFARITTDPGEFLIEWKQRSNKKIIACVGMHLPEEMIHAAGMLPVVLWEGSEPITLGHAHMQVFTCGLVRSIVDTGLKGRLEFLDGIVINDLCLLLRGLSFIMKRNVPIAFQKTLFLPPLLSSPTSRDYLLQQLEGFKESLEQISDSEITAESLRQSIRTYNEDRALLKRVYEMRRRSPGLLRAREMQAVVMSSMLMPKEEHQALLQRLVAQLDGVTPSRNEGVRLVLSGSLCQAVRADLLDLVEEVGGEVVDDDFFVGSRYFTTDGRLDIPPMESLAEAYLDMIPCSTRFHLDKDWADNLVEMATRSQAQGVVTFLPKFCEPQGIYYPHIKKRLAEAGIPEIMIETEHELISLGQIRARIQAFVETIREASWRPR